jgi:peptidoglycan/LPS O-acetylase OafA/YrhL
VVHSSWPGGHPFLASFATTASFLWLFGAGALMARHRAALAGYVARIPLLLQVTILAGALVALNSIWQFGADLQWRLLEQSGALLLVACAAFMGFLKTGLDIAPLRWLGKISYSLYLIHFIILFAVLNAFRGEISLPLVLAIVPALSIISAAVLYQLVERPSIDWGHRLSGRRPASVTGGASPMRSTPTSRTG